MTLTPCARASRFIGVICVLLMAAAVSDAQTPPDLSSAESASTPLGVEAAAWQTPVPPRAQLEALLVDLENGKERLQPLLEAVDAAPAEAWLAASPLDAWVQAAEDSTLADTAKAEWQAAIDHEQAASARVGGPLDRARLVLAAPEHLDDAAARIREMLDALAAAGSGAAPERSLSELEAALGGLSARRAAVMTELESRRETVARLREQRQAQIPTVAQMREEREVELSDVAAAEAAMSTTTDAQRAVLEARRRRAEARVIAAELDAQALPARIERLQLLIDQQDVEARWLTALVRETETLLAEQSTEELRQLSASIQSLIEREPTVQQLHASELASMRAQIDDIADTQHRIRALQEERETYLRLQDDLTQTLANVNERLEISGLTETLGGQFLEEQRRLRALGDLRFELQAVQQELVASRLETINLRDRLRQTPQPIVIDADLGEQSPEAMLGGIRYRIATSLVQSEQGLTEQLVRTEDRLSQLVSQLDELERILNETLLWWPSHSPVTFDWTARIPAATLALLDMRSWQEIRSAFVQVTVGRPAGSLLTLLIVAALYRAGRRAGPHLRALAEKTRHRFVDNIGLTFRAMGWSFLRVAPMPALLLSTSFRLERIPESGPGVEILAAVLFSAAIWWLAGHLVLLFISRNGVGTVHFGWNPIMLARLRRQLVWFLPTQFLLMVLLALAFGHPHELVFDVFGRAALIALSAWTGFLAWRLLAPNPELTQDLADRKRRFARLAIVALSGALVALALAGYLLTVGELFARMVDTVVVIGLVWIGYRVAGRALILSETRLLIRRMLEQRAKAAAAEANSPVGEHTPDIPEPHLSMEDINQQTRTLVKVVAGSALVAALFLVWADILPALNWLDGVSLWSRTVVVDGVSDISPISLQDVLLAMLLVVLFAMATRNLPGLVEIILARSTQMDGAGRYTITTLLRYTILIIATISVFSLIGLRWSELQWLVAALTLGLGFGLQEVVANFVSGIIMLFERPVRVGDTITIGEYSGTVARIRTRATTIIDWDNREVVVPNKMFITERLINWTLSDTMTRIVLPINISYQSDPDLVIETLRNIAEQHPLVMKDPSPNVLFLRFGDSALVFELRAYVAQMRDRMETISDLHRRIIRAFREQGIEIAFPQIDLHVRDMPRQAMPAALLKPEPVAALTTDSGGAIAGKATA